MEDRDFTEIDLRTMLARAQHYHPDVVEGRWVNELPRSKLRGINPQNRKSLEQC